jgi:hypothetical protein
MLKFISKTSLIHSRFHSEFNFGAPVERQNIINGRKSFSSSPWNQRRLRPPQTFASRGRKQRGYFGKSSAPEEIIPDFKVDCWTHFGPSYVLNKGGGGFQAFRVLSPPRRERQTMSHSPNSSLRRIFFLSLFFLSVFSLIYIYIQKYIYSSCAKWVLGKRIGDKVVCRNRENKRHPSDGRSREKCYFQIIFQVKFFISTQFSFLTSY